MIGSLLAIQLEVSILNRDKTRCVVSPDQRQSRGKPELEYHDQIKQSHGGYGTELEEDVKLFICRGFLCLGIPEEVRKRLER